MQTVDQDVPVAIDYAIPSRLASPRLLSLDVFRGLVILAMLLVNNLGDGPSTGYFWKHADWAPMSFGQAWSEWWKCATDSRAQLATQRVMTSLNRPLFPHEWAALQTARNPWFQIPLFTQCTLADFVMPSFMLIIGVAIPFSVASMGQKGMSTAWIWLRTFKRAAMLVLLGWILCYFRDQFANSLYGNAPWAFTFGMDVLQLLGIGYLVARILYELPVRPRALVAAILLVAHWAILRFYPQGNVPRGTFSQFEDAIGYIYSHWKIWGLITLHLGPLTIGWRGLMSVPPAAATMLIGTLMGDLLRRDDLEPWQKVRTLAMWSAILIVIGFLWAFDLPFNKPRWTPCYLVYVSGVGGMLIAVLYSIIDIHKIRGWTYPLVVFGTNALALYFVSILAKVLLLNLPLVDMSHPHTVLAIDYISFALFTVIMCAIAWKLARWARAQIGPAGYGISVFAILSLAVLWTRVARYPAAPAETSLVESLLGAILLTIKQVIGHWAGGWTFTIGFIAFWWLVLEQMYRRKIFWKL